jgi:hypothetical protein
MRSLLLAVAGATLFAPAPVAAQSLAARIQATAPDADVRFSFPSRPEVCGDGETLMIIDSTGDTRMTRGTMRRNDARFDEKGRLIDCRRGPAVVDLTRSGGSIRTVRVSVGGTGTTDGTDLGQVDANTAIAFLLDESVLSAASDRASSDMIFAATLATAESWPQLLRLARTRTLTDHARTAAIFTLSQQAGDRATAGLQSIIGDDSEELDVMQAAVFALSRIEDEETVPRLIAIARTHREPEIRRVALIWLGRTKDPRALALFEDILARRL